MNLKIDKKYLEELLLFLSFALPCAFLAWVLPEKYQISSVNVSCLLFIGFADFVSLVVLLSSSLCTYYLAKKRDRFQFLVLLAILLLAILFACFKVVSSMETNVWMQSALPLGMSYYVFRLIHYSIEVYKGNDEHIPINIFLAYMLYFPVILVGPIIRIGDWYREIRRRRWNQEMFSNGLERILYGLVKIVVLGNYLFSSALAGFVETLDDSQIWLHTYLDCVSYAGNSYMQFAGYSDVAIGFSSLLGIRVMENFNYPFLARNINDFWKRWHISLSQWCRDYIFMPVSSMSRLPWFAILASMIVLGLWHEISFRYVAWAMFHGLGIMGWYVFNRYVNLSLNPPLQRAWDFFSVLLTLNFTIVSFAWIKEDSLAKSVDVFRVLLGF